MNVPVHGKRKDNSIVRVHSSVRSRFRWVRFKQQSWVAHLIPIKPFQVQPNGGITTANP